MKELILFFGSLVFIFGQNLQSANLPLQTSTQIRNEAPVVQDVSVCDFQQEEALDILKELSNPENPGFYHREVVLRSEPEFHNLVCVSGVSAEPEPALEEQPEISLQLADNSPAEENEIPAEDWTFLTEKWTLAQRPSTCEDQNRHKINPACDNALLFNEEVAMTSQLSSSLITQK